jgi:hypothetical protein
MHECNPYSTPQATAEQSTDPGGRVATGFKRLALPGALALTLILASELWSLVALVVFTMIGADPSPVLRNAERVSIPLVIAGDVFFLIWFYRTARNARLFEGTSLREGSGMAVGAFFIPFVTLVLPCLAALETFESTYRSLSRKSPRWLVLCWWLSFILSNILLRFTQSSPQALNVILGVRLVALVFLVAMVVTLTAAQYRVGRNPELRDRLARPPRHFLADLPAGRPLARRPAPLPGAPLGSHLPPRREVQTSVNDLVVSGPVQNRTQTVQNRTRETVQNRNLSVRFGIRWCSMVWVATVGCRPQDTALPEGNRSGGRRQRGRKPRVSAWIHPVPRHL